MKNFILGGVFSYLLVYSIGATYFLCKKRGYR